MAESPSKRGFEKFYGQHFDKVYRFIFFRCSGNKAQAEDLVSEIFLKALEHFADYDPARSSSAWIMTIAKNHLKNHWRDRKLTVPLPGEGAADGEEPEGDARWLKTALVHWQAGVRKLQLMELLRGLDNDIEREIVTFHYLFGYNYKEIGEMRAMREGAVKVAAHRGILKLRKLI